MQIHVYIQNSENNNCERHEVNNPNAYSFLAKKLLLSMT